MIEIGPQDVVSILFAVAFGAAIGLEREISGKSAGLRTNVLICLGATVFTIVSKMMGGAHQQSLTRIAAGIVTGVGFLGAGDAATQVAQSTVVQSVDPSVYRELLAARPRRLHDARPADVQHLLDHVQLTQPVTARLVL